MFNKQFNSNEIKYWITLRKVSFNKTIIIYCSFFQIIYLNEAITFLKDAFHWNINEKHF